MNVDVDGVLSRARILAESGGISSSSVGIVRRWCEYFREVSEDKGGGKRRFSSENIMFTIPFKF